MTRYERLLSEYDYLDIEERNMILEGLYGDGCIWIKKGLSSGRKASILAEEIGHYETTYGDLIDKQDSTSCKQEYNARKWAYRKLLPKDEIMGAIGCGYLKPYEIAEYLCVDEAFLIECLKYYGLL